MVFHDAHWINCSQRLANIPSENQQRLASLNEYSKFQSGGIQTQLEAVPLDSNNAIQSLRLLSISKVCLIHSRRLVVVRCARMERGYVDVGNRTGILDPMG